MQTYRVYKHERYSRRRRKRKTTLTVFLLVLVIALVGVAAFVIFKPGSSVNNLKVSGITDSAVNLKWDKTENADSYCVFWKTSDTDYKKAKNIKQNSYNLTKLSQTTEYEICACAVFDTSEGGKSESKSIYTVASKPKVTQAETKEEGSVKIKWNKNSKAKYYTVQYKSSSDSAFSDKNSQKIKQSSDPTATIKKLTPGGSYDVRVRAVTYHNEKKVNGMWCTLGVTAFKKQRAIDPNKPMVALTFDDGPSNGTANERILNVLEKYGAKATFFMIGNRALEHPDNVKRKAQLGMELGNHSWDHTRYGEQVTASDIKRCSDAIFSITGQYPTAFRPPGGMVTDAIKSECQSENMPLYLWDVDTEDWSTRDASTTYSKAVDEVSDGDIILMHEIYDSTADAIEKIVPQLIKKGFQIVTCSELIEAKTGEKPQPGELYYNG